MPNNLHGRYSSLLSASLCRDALDPSTKLLIPASCASQKVIQTLTQPGRSFTEQQVLQAHPINLPNAGHDVIVQVLVISIVLGGLSLVLHGLLVHLGVLPHIHIVIHLPIVVLASLASICSVTCNQCISVTVMHVTASGLMAMQGMHVLLVL